MGSIQTPHRRVAPAREGLSKQINKHQPGSAKAFVDKTIGRAVTLFCWGNSGRAFSTDNVRSQTKSVCTGIAIRRIGVCVGQIGHIDIKRTLVLGYRKVQCDD